MTEETRVAVRSDKARKGEEVSRLKRWDIQTHKMKKIMNL
jgi:hypothetical protein